MDTSKKIIPFPQISAWRSTLNPSFQPLVVTNGCFDLLHAGHVHYLESSRALGGRLLVGVNTDDAVRRLKGSGRPLTPEHDRARVLAALQCVDYVTIFPGVQATEFLQVVRPDIYVKGGDYTIDSLNASERKALENVNAEIKILDFLPGRSTSSLVARFPPQSESGP